MKTIAVYDPAMCCSTGVCGPQVDSTLVRFASDLKWLNDQQVHVSRFNLSQTPAAFVENKLVKDVLTEKGETALPVVIIDGKIAVSGRYPSRDEICKWLNLANRSQSIPIVPKSSGCCGGGSC